MGTLSKISTATGILVMLIPAAGTYHLAALGGLH